MSLHHQYYRNCDLDSCSSDVGGIAPAVESTPPSERTGRSCHPCEDGEGERVRGVRMGRGRGSGV